VQSDDEHEGAATPDRQDLASTITDPDYISTDCTYC
jgi:hypothetical protein